MKIAAVAVAMTLLVPATSFAEEETRSYRTQTLAADGLGIALLIAGSLAEGDDGHDTAASDALFMAGGLTLMIATPAIHAAHGQSQRTPGSVLMRVGLTGLGAVAAIGMRSGCSDPPDALLRNDFFCEFDYVGYGVLGGFVVASIIDAAFLTDEPVEERPRWTPQVTASRDGARVGVGMAW